MEKQSTLEYDPETESFNKSTKHKSTNKETNRTEKAFDNASMGYSLFGKKLHPYSLARQTAGHGVGGIKYGKLSDEEQVALKETGVYRGMVYDVILVTYLCWVDDESLFVAYTDPTRFVADAFAWATEKEIQFPNVNFVEAAKVFFPILNDAFASFGQLKDTAKRKSNGAGDLQDYDDSGNS